MMLSDSHELQPGLGEGRTAEMTQSLLNYKIQSAVHSPAARGRRSPVQLQTQSAGRFCLVRTAVRKKRLNPLFNCIIIFY